MIFLRAFAAWLAIIAVETLHGILRTLFVAPFIGDFRARQIGVFVGSALILAVAYLLICRVRADSARQLAAIGIFWMILTLAFEIALAYLAGMSVERVLEDYDLRNGGLMPFGLLFLFFAPIVSARLRKCQ